MSPEQRGLIRDLTTVLEKRNAELERLRKELRQCRTELEEAAKLLNEHYPGLGVIYAAAVLRVTRTLGAVQ